MRPDKPLAYHVASTIAAVRNCDKSGNAEWSAIWRDVLRRLGELYLPHGSGVDDGALIDVARSTPERVRISTEFHHMGDNGMYCGWSAHVVTARASLVFGIDVTVSGRDRNGIKDYLAERFADALQAYIPGAEWAGLVAKSRAYVTERARVQA